MALSQANLYVANSALDDGQLSPNTPLFAVDRLHAEWSKTWLAKAVTAGQVRGQSCSSREAHGTHVHAEHSNAPGVRVAQ